MSPSFLRALCMSLYSHLPDQQFGTTELHRVSNPMMIPEQPSAHTRPAQQPMPSGAQGLVRAAVTLSEPSIDTL